MYNIIVTAQSRVMKSLIEIVITSASQIIRKNNDLLKFHEHFLLSTFFLIFNTKHIDKKFEIQISLD